MMLEVSHVVMEFPERKATLGGKQGPRRFSSWPYYCGSQNPRAFEVPPEGSKIGRGSVSKLKYRYSNRPLCKCALHLDDLFAHVHPHWE